MCGIGGIVRYDHQPIERRRIERLRDRLRHRGPDGDGVFLAEHVGLAHTRLALVDPVAGAQPLSSGDGRYTLVYNGEIYNAPELRAELAASWTFRTRCDAEVLLAAYVRWGPACCDRLNGMFAFFVWDGREEVGFAGRDLLGVKPFVYAYDGSEFVFASEAKAVLGELAPRPRARLSALLEYLVVPCLSGVETPIFEGLEYLPPGHGLCITREGVDVLRWGSYDLLDPDDVVTAAELRSTFESAVRRTLAADAPVGVYLSGGLDSTAIAAAARATGAGFPTFTVAFDDQAEFDYARSRIVVSDDEPFAGYAAGELGLARTTVPVPRDRLTATLARASRHNDALPAWEQEIAQDHLARAAAATCKAVLVGDAADETHYGYHFLLDETATHSPRGVIDRFTAPIVRPDVLPDPIGHFDAHYRALCETAGHRWDTLEQRRLATTWLIVHRWLPRLLHNGDIHAMAHGLEARVPFADRELLALTRRIGPRRGLACGVEKMALREAFRGLVPESIRTRRKSALPKDQMVAALYKREASRLLAESGRELAGVADLKIAETLCAPERPIEERECSLLFRLICLVHWVRAYEVALP